MCNWAYGSTRRLDALETILEHQIEKHGRIGDVITITLRLPFAIYLQAKKNPKFWEAWRNRNKIKTP